MAEIIVTKENFEDEVIKSDKPVLLDFWAAWCGPCKMLSHIIEELAQDYEGKAKTGKVNVDSEPELASAFNVSSIPTVVVIKHGKITATSVGYRPKEDLEKLLIQ